MVFTTHRNTLVEKQNRNQEQKEQKKEKHDNRTKS